MPAADYVALGERFIRELLAEEFAAPWLEIEARIADTAWRGAGRVDPHHLSSARLRLMRKGAVISTRTATRGGREVTMLEAVGGRRLTATTRAAARKRLLLSRYLGWSQGTESRPGLIGPAAEQVVHASLLESGRFHLMNRNGGQISRFLNHDLDGALDNAVIFAPIIDGLPQAPIAVPIEVKNMRDWVYPISQERYQVLDKASQLQRAHPTFSIAPVLVCRRAHLTAFRMAKDLGFFIVETRRQYIASHVEEEAVNEVRKELGFLDLVGHTEADAKVVHLFADVFTARAPATSIRWQATATDSHMASYLRQMRHSATIRGRQQVLRVIREEASRIHADLAGGW